MKHLIFFTAVMFLFHGCSGQNQDLNAELQLKKVKEEMSDNMERMTFGGGCFWCIEPIFEQLDGVEKVTAGYAGGHTKNPNYKDVTTGETGHAEVIQIEYNPNKISYDDLLEVFWNVHDPTTLNRQGNDVGTQYRSIILYENEQQNLIAKRSMREYEASGMYEDKFTTEIVPLEKFYKAEAYHQGYYNTVGDGNPYCTFVITPKIEKFFEKFRSRLKPEFR